MIADSCSFKVYAFLRESPYDACSWTRIRCGQRRLRQFFSTLSKLSSCWPATVQRTKTEIEHENRHVPTREQTLLKASLIASLQIGLLHIGQGRICQLVHFSIASFSNTCPHVRLITGSSIGSRETQHCIRVGRLFASDRS